MTMHDLFGDFEYYVVALISLTAYVLAVVVIIGGIERLLERMGWVHHRPAPTPMEHHKT
jgi:hypothetical protein